MLSKKGISMKVSKATKQDIACLMLLYESVIEDMHHQGLMFWNENYPIFEVKEDVLNNRQYVLKYQKEILASFALNLDNPGHDKVSWSDNNASFVYLDRLAVNPKYKRQGLASMAIQCAKNVAYSMNKQYLRLFVASSNTPAVNLYKSQDFTLIEDVFVDRVNGYILEEWGFEIKL